MPLPPLVIVPAQVSLVSADRFDARVYVTFEIPSANSDGSEPADLGSVEVYALTTQPEQGRDTQPSFDDWIDVASLLATIEVRGPGDIESTVEGTDPAVEGKVGVQGAQVTVVEHLTPETLIPVVLDDDEDDLASEEDPVIAPTPGVPLFIPPLPRSLRRTYVVRGVSRRGREGAPSSWVAVPLSGPPSSPSAPTITYTENQIDLVWVRPVTARLPIQEPGTNGVLDSTPVFELLIPSVFDVYDVTELSDTDQMQEPKSLNDDGILDTVYTDPKIIFGAERCYAVRMVDSVEGMEVRSAPSPSTCVTFVDTFPPAAPSGLIAVATEAAINLVWDANAEPDVAGYIVLRGGGPDSTLVPLTPEPIEETTFRDSSVEEDAIYEYAIQAVDQAPQANVSPGSDRVVERAR